MHRINKQRGPWELRAEVRDAGKILPIVIKIDPDELHLRQKGRKTAYSIPWGAVYTLAARAEADRKRREKIAAKKSKGRKINPLPSRGV